MYNAVPVTCPTAESCGIGLPTLGILLLVIEFQQYIPGELQPITGTPANVADGCNLCYGDVAGGTHRWLIERLTIQEFFRPVKPQDRWTDRAVGKGGRSYGVAIQ